MSVTCHKEIERALAATGLPYTIESGSRHLKLILKGRLIGVCSRGKDMSPRGLQNTLAEIKRAARALTETSGDTVESRTRWLQGRGRTPSTSR